MWDTTSRTSLTTNYKKGAEHGDFKRQRASHRTVGFRFIVLVPLQSPLASFPTFRSRKAIVARELPIPVSPRGAATLVSRKSPSTPKVSCRQEPLVPGGSLKCALALASHIIQEKCAVISASSLSAGNGQLGDEMASNHLHRLLP